MKNENCGIYLISERETGKGYVGFTTQVFTERWRRHKDRFPPQLFDYEVLLPLPLGATEKELKKLERFYISELDTMSPNGFNRTRGGNGSGPRSPVTRKKLSEAHKAREASLSEEEKQKRSQKRSEAAKASFANEETRKKLSEAVKAYYDSATPEEKQKKSDALKAHNASMTPEEKQKKSDALKAQHASMPEEKKRERSRKLSEAAKAQHARKRAALTAAIAATEALLSS